MRPVASVLTACADLWRALHGPQPPPLPAKVMRAARRAVDLIAEAVREDVAEHGPEAAAASLGVGSATLRRWRAPGGWLCTTEPREGGAARELGVSPSAVSRRMKRAGD